MPSRLRSIPKLDKIPCNNHTSRYTATTALMVSATSFTCRSTEYKRLQKATRLSTIAAGGCEITVASEDSFKTTTSSETKQPRRWIVLSVTKGPTTTGRGGRGLCAPRGRGIPFHDQEDNPHPRSKHARYRPNRKPSITQREVAILCSTPKFGYRQTARTNNRIPGGSIRWVETSRTTMCTKCMHRYPTQMAMLTDTDGSKHD